MNRMFKTVFHNGELGEKPIVQFSCEVKNGKKFKSLNEESKKYLINEITIFQEKLEAFKAEISKSIV